MRAAILQPGYLPWIGFFNMVKWSDTFIILDDVQFSDSAWQHRNRIKTPMGFQWLTVPVLKKLDQKIKGVKINNKEKWAKNHWKAIKFNYSKARFFGEYSEFFEETYSREWSSLLELDMHIIKGICNFLRLKPNFEFASNLNVGGNALDHVIKLCKKIGATEYLNGPAGKSYMTEEDFAKEGIKLVWHEYSHPTYNQLYGEFVPYMSVIDLLFNEGEKSPEIIWKKVD